MKNTAELLTELKQTFLQAAIAEDAEPMKKYLKDKFEFYGLKSPLRKETQKQFWSKHEKPQDKDSLKTFVKALWEEPYRELHYQALELLERPIKKADDSWIEFIEYLITTNSWWDSVDGIASKIVGTYLKKYPNYNEQYPPIWIESDNMWLRRTAILYQLKYKKETDWQRLQDYILLTAHEQEFFIRKAAGWMLREYSKTNSQAVLDFVADHEDQLSGLTKREALKWMKNKGIINEG
jgi:3-methyladenine DNA glycosylase AlkD